jgi:hypothetical protein
LKGPIHHRCKTTGENSRVGGPVGLKQQGEKIHRTLTFPRNWKGSWPSVLAN